MTSLSFVRIDSCHHPYAIPALEVYQASFPLHEQMSPAFWYGVPRPESMFTWYAIVGGEDPGQVIGMLLWSAKASSSSGKVAFLWYICLSSLHRGTGFGTEAYRMLLDRVFQAGCPMMVFEVEMPEIAGAPGSDERILAQRRIDWYRRQGAKVLSGVRYFQKVDNGSPPTQMHIMVHEFVGVCDPESAYRAACEALDEEIEVLGGLDLI